MNQSKFNVINLLPHPSHLYIETLEAITLIMKTQAFGYALFERKSSVEMTMNRFRKLEKSLNVVTTRRRELALAKVSLYIVFVMLLCHSVRLIPNTYEMIQTYTQVK